MTRVICIGECMVELRAGDGNSDTFARSYAGDAYNTAVYLKRSLPQAVVQFLTATGDDALSSSMRNAWRLQGVDAELAFTISGASPGLYLIDTDRSGERRFQYWRKDSAARHWLSLLLDKGESVLWDADLVYISGISLAILKPEQRVGAIALLERLKRHVGLIAFDPNLRLSLWETRDAAQFAIGAVLRLADIALPSTEDLTLLFDVDSPDSQMDLLEALGVQEAAVTRGSVGCTISVKKRRIRVPAVDSLRVVDTSGAGDSFNGAYLAARLQGGSVEYAVESGMAVASRVVSHRGAIVPSSISHPMNA
jgi:2-dehydro-3-deoxygluconokinase